MTSLQTSWVYRSLESMKIPAVVSSIAGPSATNLFMDNHFSGGAQLAKGAKP